MISPLLANLYLHWFEHRFHRSDGPGTWAKAHLVRYADDFVILARYQGRRLQEWVESTLEGRFQLTINRDKTRVVNLKEPSASLSFLGFTFRYDRDLQGRDRRYLNVFPSDKSLARVRTKLRELLHRQRVAPILTLIAKVNRSLGGWSRYFSHGYPRRAFRQVNRYVVASLTSHLSPSESTALPAPGRPILLRPVATPRLATVVRTAVDSLCMPPSKPFEEAGCGKSARPV